MELIFFQDVANVARANTHALRGNDGILCSNEGVTAGQEHIAFLGRTRADAAFLAKCFNVTVLVIIILALIICGKKQQVRGFGNKWLVITRDRQLILNGLILDL